MTASDYGFIRFSDICEICSCNVIMKVANLSELRFYVEDGAGSTFFVCTIWGEKLSDGHTLTNNWFKWDLNLGTIAACGDCFRLLAVDVGGKFRYSNVMMYDSEPEDTCLVKYWCDEPEFGIDYDGNNYNQIRLPILLSDPTNKKEETIYVDSNGKRSVLYRELRRRYTLKSDFLPADIHDMISVMLAHDHVVIDEVEMDEDGTYEVDWENVDTSGDVDLAMGKTTMAEIFVRRNTIC